MKIPVFGKSGPRLVTTGLVCASAAVGPSAIQQAAISTTKYLRQILDIDSPCPGFILRQPITAYSFVVLFGSAETLPDFASAFAPRRQGVIYRPGLCRSPSARICDRDKRAGGPTLR